MFKDLLNFARNLTMLLLELNTDKEKEEVASREVGKNLKSQT